MASVELMIFAIRAGLKLGQQVREVYIESTRSRALTLPLPAINLQPDFNSALRYFSGDGAIHLSPDSELQRLFKTAVSKGEAADVSLKSSLLNYALELMSLDKVDEIPHEARQLGVPLHESP